MKALISALMLAALPAAAPAQTWIPGSGTPRPGAPAVDVHRYQAEQHRQAMTQLRLQADQRQAFARQLEIEASLRRLRTEAARQPEPAPTWAPRALRAPEQERREREAASARRETQAAGTGQIDAWLDRVPN
jgi:hypothetical protein